MARRLATEQPPTTLPTRRSSIFDPAPELAKLRETRPVSRLLFSDGHEGWLVTSHTLARTILGDPRFSVHPPRLAVGEALQEVEHGVSARMAEALAETSAGAVIELDPPDHTRVRRLQTSYFTVRRVNERQTQLEEIVRRQLDAIEASSTPVDLVASFALPVASLALCDLLGIPHTERASFEEPQKVMVDPSAPAKDREAATIEFSEFARMTVERKRADPGDDVLSWLIAADELTDRELAGVAGQLISAGHHTTANMIALSAFFLLHERQCWDALQREPSLIDGAVEELLRYLNLIQTGAFARTALEDVDFDGIRMSRGESVWVSLAAANRDPDKFPNPDVFDPRRDASGHVAFGHGRHMCLGQHLARLELKVSIAGLVERFPGLQLAAPLASIRRFHGDHQLYGVHELPVRWDEARG
jgi:cytochrome P450